MSTPESGHPPLSNTLLIGELLGPDDGPFFDYGLTCLGCGARYSVHAPNNHYYETAHTQGLLCGFCCPA